MTRTGTNRNRVIAWIAVALVVASVAVLLSLADLSPKRPSALVEKRVGMLTEHAARSDEAGLSAVTEALAGSFALREVNLGVPGALDSLDVLVVVGAGHLPDARLFEIDQFLMRGGSAAFLLDGADLSPDRARATAVRGNLFGYVASYGAAVNPDLTVAPLEASTSYPEPGGSLPYAFWPFGVIERQPRGGIEAPLEGVVFAWASSISLNDRLPAGVTASVVAAPPPESWTTLAFADLDPESLPARDRGGQEASGGVDSPDALAVAMEGVLVSAFDGMPVIVEDADGSVEFTDPPGRLTRSEPTRLFVVGSSRMFDDIVLDRAPANLELLVAAVSWLAAS